MESFELEVLPLTLIIATFPESEISSFCHSIVKCAFFDSSNEFFSWTNCGAGISLVFEERHLSNFPIDSLTLASQKWKCIHVIAGEMGGQVVDMAGSVNKIANILAKHQISIYQISTFNADLTLVQEGDLSRALLALSSHFQLNQKLNLENINTEEPLEVTSIVESPNSFDHPFSTHLPQAFHIVGLRDSSQFKELIHPILQLMMYNELDSTFFSFTQVQQQVSMILDSETINYFPHDSLNRLFTPDLPSHLSLNNNLSYDKSLWTLVHITDVENMGLGFEETGIVAGFTKKLMMKGVFGCFYISSFLCDFVLVPRDTNIALLI